MKAFVLGLVVGLAASSAQAQLTSNPETTQKLRKLACREQVARDMRKPVQLPPGTTRAWEVEQDQREKLCLMKA